MTTRPIKGIEVKVKRPPKKKYDYSAGFVSRLRLETYGEIVAYKPCLDCPSEEEINCVCYVLIDYIRGCVA